MVRLLCEMAATVPEAITYELDPATLRLWRTDMACWLQEEAEVRERTLVGPGIPVFPLVWLGLFFLHYVTQQQLEGLGVAAVVLLAVMALGYLVRFLYRHQRTPRQTKRWPWGIP